MHEILTLQFGNRSNYLCTHFWNTQESYFNYGEGSEDSVVDHDVHFRPGEGTGGIDTYTARTVIYDLKGAFGSLKKLNALYESLDDDPMPSGLWDGKVVRHTESAIQQSEYQQKLDAGLPLPKLTSNNVRFWSDYNRVFYHPRSIVQLNEFELGSKLTPFDSWELGKESFELLDREHDLLDRDFRPFAEESDHLQGIQIYTHPDDGWGGFTSSYLEGLRDEYPKTSIWVWGIENSHQAKLEQRRMRELNICKTWSSVLTNASLYIPLSDPPRPLPAYVSLDENSQWQTGGLLCAAVETLTLPTRTREDARRGWTMSDMAMVLDSSGNQRIAHLETSVVTEGSRENGATKGESDDESSPRLDMDLSSARQRSTAAGKRSVFGRVVSVRGVPEAAGPDTDGQLHRIRERTRSTDLEFPLLDSFPSSIFKNLSVQDSHGLGVEAALATSSDCIARLDALCLTARRYADVADREDLSSQLAEIADAYREGWDGFSDDDDDDN